MLTQPTINLTQLAQSFLSMSLKEQEAFKMVAGLKQVEAPKKKKRKSINWFSEAELRQQILKNHKPASY
jgi:hypothetical protein